MIRVVLRSIRKGHIGIIGRAMLGVVIAPTRLYRNSLGHTTRPYMGNLLVQVLKQ